MVEENIIYRNVTEDDALEILSVDQSRYTSDPLSIFFIKDSCRMFKESVITATHRHKIVGFCIGLSSKSSTQGWISALTVLKNYEGKGIGKNLITKVVESLKNLNCDRVGLTVEPNSKAQKLYEKVNFKQITFLKDYYGNGKDRFIMEKVFTK